MRRKTRRSLIHAALFGGMILFVLYLTHPESKKTFAWTKIRYKTAASTLPEPRGVCPGLADSSKAALVVSRVAADGDSEWLDALANKYHLCVYTTDAPADATERHLQVPANRGHEAMTYLTFLIDNYDYVPAGGAVFVHGARWAWHNDEPNYDNAALLASLNVSAALAPWGYHNLRCDWRASTCPLSSGPPQGSLETSMRALLEPWNTRAASDAALPRALAVLFGGEEHASAGEAFFLGRAETVRAQCCAQFTVARSRVWQHSRNEYVALRQWLLDGSRNAAPRDDRVAGRILSYLWHILFIERGGSSSGVDLERLNQLACPRADECYCRLYGLCNLEHCTSPESCHGRYRLPPNLRLPDDWAATHS